MKLEFKISVFIFLGHETSQCHSQPSQREKHKEAYSDPDSGSSSRVLKDIET
jgi:hypothetical protein